MPNFTPIQIEKSSSQELLNICEMLGRAFFEDPFYQYTLPDIKKRKEVLSFGMRVPVLYGQRYGRLYVTSEAPHGAAIWMPPNTGKASTSQLLRSSLLSTAFKLGFATLSKMMEIHHKWDMLRVQQPAHWYLMLIGVEPSQQGKGIGSGLLAPMLFEADQAKLPCYLETVTERDVAFYRKHHFDVVATGHLPNREPYWTMLRHPRTEN